MKFSLAVALLINSSSAIKLYKDNKPNAFASVKSQNALKDEVNLSI